MWIVNVIKYSASSIPVVQLGLSSPTMTAASLFDAAVTSAKATYTQATENYRQAALLNASRALN
jgi:hypothetical protein